MAWDFPQPKWLSPVGALSPTPTRWGTAHHPETTLPARHKRGPHWPHPAPPCAMGQEALEHPCTQMATTGWAGGGRQLWGCWQPSSSCPPLCLGIRHRPKCPRRIREQRDNSTIWTSGDDSLFNRSGCLLSSGDLLAYKRPLARQPTD